MPEGSEGWENLPNPWATPQADWSNMGGQAPTVGYQPGSMIQDAKGNTYQLNTSYSGGADGHSSSWDYVSPEALKQQQASNPSTAYDFSRYQSAITAPTLAAGDITRDPTTGQWNVNMGNEYLNRMYNTADKGANYMGLAALLQGTQDYGAVRGTNLTTTPGQNANNLSDATIRSLAQTMGMDPNSSREQVLANANNYALIKGMGGPNEGNRTESQVLYQKQEDGTWKPIKQNDWWEREKGSWWSEGGKYITVPLAVVGAGVLAGAAGGAAAGEGAAAAGAGAGAETGITAYGGSALGQGTLGAGGAYAGGAGGSTLGGGLYGAGTIGEGYLAGSGMLGSNAALGYGGAAAPTLAGSASQGLGMGALYGEQGITAAMGPGSYYNAYTPWYEKLWDQATSNNGKNIRDALKQVLKAYGDGQQGVSQAYGGGGRGFTPSELVANDYAKYEERERMKRLLAEKGDGEDKEKYAALIASLRKNSGKPTLATGASVPGS